MSGRSSHTAKSPKILGGYGKAVHGWHATVYSNGKRRVYVTFEEVKTGGN